MKVPRFETKDPGFAAAWARLVARQDGPHEDRVVADTRDIVEQVRVGGDQALVAFTARFEQRPGLTAAELEVPRPAWDQALGRLSPELRQALERAAARIRAFHGLQRGDLLETHLDDGRGIVAELLVRPLARVGLYVPGGTAAYPSTVLMNALPAKVAGVPEVVMVTPAKGGQIADPVLAAAAIAGVDRVFGIGGAQAVAALAYGTQSVPAVDKIVGPGNAWVQEAKRQVYGQVDIDTIAGPSEVLIVADESADPEVVAADLLAQAEHDVRSAALLITWVPQLADQVAEALARQVATLPRANEATAAILGRGGVVLCKDSEEALALANQYAPEHLGLAVEQPRRALEKIDNAGAVFLGHHTPEALGDYNAGVNHVLPTSGAARFGSPLSVHDFVKRTSVLAVEAQGLLRIGDDAVRLARAEGLEAHARAIELRQKRG